MTTSLRAHFDGKVIVPDEPVDLPHHQQLIVHIARDPAESLPQGVSGPRILQAIRELNWPAADVQDVARALADDPSTVDPDGW